jgi:ornithine cyclodeaminase/alanine dehydrogenase-like protein (mu-crystallin family)
VTIYVDADSVHQLLDYPGLVEGMRRAHLAAPPFTRTMMVDDPNGSGDRFLSLLGWTSDVAAIKAIGVFPGNVARTPPEPSVQGVVTLFDAATGRPLLVGDGAALTFRKTAADSALGVSLLARPDAEVLLVIGAGGLGPHVAMAHTSVRRSIRRLLIWNRTASRAQELARTLRISGVEIAAVDDLDAAVASADIISSVTSTDAPLIKGALLKPGSHVDLIGSYLPHMREADDDAIRRARVFVDIRKKETGAGELLQPIANGVMTWDDIQGDLFELCQRRRDGRRSADEITLYKNLGGGHLDLFTVRHLHSCVLQKANGAR